MKHSLKPVRAEKKKVFKLTDEGKEFCRSLFKRFSALVLVAIEPSLEVYVSGCKVYDGGYREVISGEEMAFCCVHYAESYKHEASEKAGKIKE